MRKSKWVVGILAVVLFALLGQAAFAAYPEKQITVLQGFKPGGGSDTLAQLTQPYLEKVLGQSFGISEKLRADVAVFPLRP